MILPELLILRHGETEWNLEGRMQAALDSPLTKLGRSQAMRQNQLLRAHGVSDWAWFSSPQGRAQSTAGIAADGLTRDIATDTRLREIGMGDWTGLLRADIADQFPHLFETDGLSWYDHAPGGEGLIAVHTRCMDFLMQLSQPAVIVTHGITSRVLRCIALGLPVDAFDRLGGGQGVVYHLANGQSHLLA